jgi:tRNA-specific 2-thiouridylase
MNGPFESEVRVRSHGDDVPSVVEAMGAKAVVEFATPQRGIAPGQSVVFYRGDDLLGGGRIREATR